MLACLLMLAQDPQPPPAPTYSFERVFATPNVVERVCGFDWIEPDKDLPNGALVVGWEGQGNMAGDGGKARIAVLDPMDGHVLREWIEPIGNGRQLALAHSQAKDQKEVASVWVLSKDTPRGQVGSTALTRRSLADGKVATALTPDLVYGKTRNSRWYGKLLDVGDANGDGAGDVVIVSWFLRHEQVPDSQSHTSVDVNTIECVSGLDGKILWTNRGEWNQGASWTSSDEPTPPNRLRRIGFDLRLVDDLDGDGRRDLLSGEPAFNANVNRIGRVSVLSGSTGAPIFTMAGRSTLAKDFRPSWLEEYGTLSTIVETKDPALGRVFLVPCVEVDLDAFADHPRFDLRSLKDGSIVGTKPAPRFRYFFPDTLEALPDVDGDGRADVLIAASGEGTGTNFVHGVLCAWSLGRDVELARTTPIAEWRKVDGGSYLGEHVLVLPGTPTRIAASCGSVVVLYRVAAAR